MGFIEFNYRSEALGHYVDITVCYPTDRLSIQTEESKLIHHSHTGDSYPLYHYTPGMKFQTVYLMHGGGDDHSLTYRYTNAERYAQSHNVILVTPNIPNSFGLDTKYGFKNQTFISEELPQVIQSLFASSTKREDNFIVGYAMGGNVALTTALLHPDKFTTCVDISGGGGLTLDTKRLAEEIDAGKHLKVLQTAVGSGAEMLDLYEVAKKNMDEGKEVPNFVLCVGENEHIISRTDADARLLKELGYDVQYNVYPGYTHNFKFWDFAVKEALDKLLILKNKPIF